MGVVALASVKGSPGVTTAAVGLAARWPRPAVLIEADPAGGDLAARFVAHRTPGVPEWAADSRLASAQLGPMSATVENYTSFLSGIEVPVVFGGTLEQMPTATSLLASSGALISVDADILLDIGQLNLHEQDPGLAFAADVVLLVTRSWPESIDAVLARRDRIAWTFRADADRAPGLGVLLVEDSPYPLREVQDALGLPVLGTLPADPGGADVLCGRCRPGRAWTRTPLLRACRTLAADLVKILGDQDAVSAADRLGA